MSDSPEFKYKTREEWLVALVEALRPYIQEHGYALPETVRISCGWPSTRALSARRRRIGECWSYQAAEDKVPQIFISPVLASELEVSETVVHELGHAALGPEVGHKAAFKSFMRAVGLTGKPTATLAGPGLIDFLGRITADLGPYPNSRLDKLARPTKKQTTRMRKITCPNGDAHEEPYILRASAKTIEAGLPTCFCGTLLEADEPEDEEGGE